MRTLLIFCCMLFTIPLLAQEVCDNGMDDDGDGLIDLNDTTDCNCLIPGVIESLLPNPSFDDFTPGPDCASNQTNGAPDGPGQADCIAGWSQASSATTDAWHLLTYNGNPPFWPAAVPQPIPSGLAVAGFFIGVGDFTEDYREYLGSCLPDGPLTVGEEYRMNFQLGFVDSVPLSPDSIVYSPSTLELSVYGITDCDMLRFEGNTCPEIAGAEGWELITTITITGQADSWQEIDIDFTPDFPYAAVALGGSCAPTQSLDIPYWRNYYFIDELRLNTSQMFMTETVGTISVFGDDICSPDARMEAEDFMDGTYQWYRNGIAIPGANTRTYFPPLDEDFPGLYSVLIDRPGGCGIAGPVDLIRPVSTNSFQDSVLICPTEETIIRPNSGTLAQSYLWEDGSTEPERIITETGTYSVTVTSFCEQVIETIEAVRDIQPTYTLSIEPASFCAGDTVSIYIATNWQINIVGFLSNGQGSLSIGDTVDFIIENPVNLNIFSFGDCEVQDTSVLLQPANFFTDLIVEEFNCTIPFAQVTPIMAGQFSNDYTYSWQTLDGTVISTDSIFQAPMPDDYRLVVSHPELDCNQETEFTVILNGIAAPITGEVIDIDCNTQMGRIIASTPDSLVNTLVWSDANGNEVGTGLELMVDIPGVYTLASRSQNGACARFRTFTVGVNAGFEYDLSTALDTCAGLTDVSLNVMTTGLQIEWFRVGEVQPFATGNGIQTSLEAGDYEVNLFRDAVCQESISFTIDPFDTLSLSSELILLDCEETSIVLSASGGVAPYTYSLAADLDPTDGIFTGILPGTYFPQVTDAAGCTVATAPIAVEEREILIVEAGPDQSINLGESTRINVQTNGANVPIDTIIWSPVEGLSCADCENPTAAPIESTVYQVAYIAVDGCITLDSIRIGVVPTGRVYIPNAFSPNFDGVNDLFRLFPDQSIDVVLDLRVYNRWGGEVYIWELGDDAFPGWDGTQDGRDSEAGIYVYQARVQLLNGTIKTWEGSVALMR